MTVHQGDARAVLPPLEGQPGDEDEFLGMVEDKAGRRDVPKCVDCGQPCNVEGGRCTRCAAKGISRRT